MIRLRAEKGKKIMKKHGGSRKMAHEYAARILKDKLYADYIPKEHDFIYGDKPISPK